jgi:hypothetical protein
MFSEGWMTARGKTLIAAARADGTSPYTPLCRSYPRWLVEKVRTSCEVQVGTANQDPSSVVVVWLPPSVACPSLVCHQSSFSSIWSSSSSGTGLAFTVTSCGLSPKGVHS